MHTSVDRAAGSAAAIEVVRQGTDVRVEVRTTHLPQLFDAAALAMAALLRLPDVPAHPDAETLRGALQEQGDRLTARTLALSGRDPCELMLHWLRELLYLHETQRFIYTGARIITLEPTLCADVRGVQARGAACRELKAVTYHDLSIHLAADSWIARISYEV